MSQNEQIKPQLEKGWLTHLAAEFDKSYFKSLKAFLKTEKSQKVIYPPGKNIFEAYNRTKFNELKVVILGQDPYHGPNQAHGLCFSVNKGVQLPPSLKNIFKEIKADLNIDQPQHGDLTEWAEQGVFLLNATLTVEDGKAGSHQGKGWENFTDATIRIINENKKNVVFILWGRFAQDKARLIDDSNHLILKSAHPSPLSAYNGFFGCKHFSKCNEYLKKTGQTPINWGRN